MSPTSILGKTDRGRAEIANRSAALSRTERNLLVVADGRRSVQELLAMTGTSDPSPLAALLANGFIEVTGEARREPASSVPSTAQVPELDKPVTADAEQSAFRRTYSFLAAQIPEFFGLTAFTLTLRLEKASTLADLEPIKHKLIEAVERKRGQAAAAAYRDRLLMLARDRA